MARSRIGGRGNAKGAKGTQRGKQNRLGSNKRKQAARRRMLGSFRSKP